MNGENAPKRSKREVEMAVSPTLVKMVSLTHVFWYQLTGGLIGGSFLGRPILLLTTTGRKSGRSYTTPLQYLQDGDDVVLAASNGGSRRHPDWWLNLRAHPEAEIQIRAERKRVTAEIAKGRERPALETTRPDVPRLPGLPGHRWAGDPGGDPSTKYHEEG